MPFATVPDTAALARAIVDTVRDPLLVLDHDLRIVAASRAFYQTFHLVDQDIRGHLIYEIEDAQWNIPELRTILETIAKDHAAVEGYEVDRDFPRVGRRIMLLNGRKVFYEQASHTTTLLAFEDVTDRRAVEDKVQALVREKDMLLQEMQHRVANSLQIIASILLMKARTVQSEETRLQLEDAHQRVLSVAAVQQHLQVTGRDAPIAIGSYLTKLCETLAQSMIGESRPIALNSRNRYRHLHRGIPSGRQHWVDCYRTSHECLEACVFRRKEERGNRGFLQGIRYRLEADGIR